MKITQKTKVIVGLSGGVDSAVSAFLLKEQGYDVTGIYMQNWVAEKNDVHCSADQDLQDARAVCDHLQIPFQTVNFAREYWDQVFQYCLDEFVAGRTPNPDIGCNQFIKFDLFLKHALNLQADFLATGHYAKRDNQCRLLKATDANKDQTYFLYTLNQQKLSHILFPLAEIEKSTVRKMAKKIGLPNADKKDSTGICFIGERKFKTFLQDFILARPGEIRSLDGKSLGKHDGLMFYTLGQRQGLKIGGQKHAHELPWYVVRKDIQNNILMVAQGENHPALFSSTLQCEKVNWIAGQAPVNAFSCAAKIRYRQADQVCSVKLLHEFRASRNSPSAMGVSQGGESRFSHLSASANLVRAKHPLQEGVRTQCETPVLENNTAQVIFEKPQRAITPGQSIVFYDHAVCLGGGIIQAPVLFDTSDTIG